MVEHTDKIQQPNQLRCRKQLKLNTRHFLGILRTVFSRIGRQASNSRIFTDHPLNNAKTSYLWFISTTLWPTLKSVTCSKN